MRARPVDSISSWMGTAAGQRRGEVLHRRGQTHGTLLDLGAECNGPSACAIYSRFRGKSFRRAGVEGAQGQGLEIADPAGGVADRRTAQRVAQSVPQGAAAVWVRCKGDGGIHIGVHRVDGEVAQAGIRQVAEAEAFEEGGSDQADGGNAHPQRLAGGGAAGLRQRVERDVDLVVIGHVAAADGGVGEAVGGDAVASEGAGDVVAEQSDAGFRAHHQEPAAGHAVQHPCPGRDRLGGKFVRVVHGAEGQQAGAVFRQARQDRLVVEAETAETDPA